VKQFRERDLGVIVNLKGRMPNPQIEFASDADYAISTSDLLSYLITGTPGFDFSANQSQVLASFLSPTISALAADRLRRSLGSFVDAFQFELGTYNANGQGSTSRNISDYLLTATINAEKRLTRELYLGVNTGLCGFRTGNYFSGVGAKLEYRFQPNLSLQSAYEPASQSRTSCIQSEQTLLGLVPTPSQISFALRHTWRF
jgi:autotransporter translocation and assembly factor TamB